MKTSFSRIIFQNFDQSLVNGEFPHCLKQAEVIAVFKNKENLDKSNNRPVNFLPVRGGIDIIFYHSKKYMKGWFMTKCLIYWPNLL